MRKLELRAVAHDVVTNSIRVSNTKRLIVVTGDVDVCDPGNLGIPEDEALLVVLPEGCTLEVYEVPASTPPDNG